MPGAISGPRPPQETDPPRIRGSDDRTTSAIVKRNKCLCRRVRVALPPVDRVPPSVGALRGFQIARECLQAWSRRSRPAKAEQLIGSLLRVTGGAAVEKVARTRHRGFGLRLLARVVIKLHCAQPKRSHPDPGIRRRRALMKTVPVTLGVLTGD